MRVAIASDHTGLGFKLDLGAYLRKLGYEVLDLGTHSTEPVDYPDYAEAVGLAILSKRADRRILICGSGVGALVAANRLPGIRTGLCHDMYSAHQGVEHDDMNVLVLGEPRDRRGAGSELAHALLATQFSGEERYRRRLQKVEALETRYAGGATRFEREETTPSTTPRLKPGACRKE